MSHATRRTPSGLPRRFLPAIVLGASALASLVAGCGDTLWDKYNETYTESQTTARATAFDATAATPSWTALPSAPTDIVGDQAVVAPSGRLYAIASNGKVAVRFDPLAATGTGEWTRLPDLPEARAQAVAVTCGSLVCVASGFRDGQVSGAVDVLNDATATATWIKISMPVKRFEAAVVGLQDRLLVIGGRDETGAVSRDIWQLRPVTTTAFWQRIGFLSVARTLPGAFVLPGPKVHVVSGHDGDGQALKSEEVIDFDLNVLLPPVTIPNGRVAPQCVVVNGKGYVFDSRSYDVSVSGRIDRFDPLGAGSGWTQRASAPFARRGASMSPLPDGRIAVAGGLEDDETTIEAHIFDDADNLWSITASMPLDLLGGFFAPINGKATYVGGINVKQKRRKLKTSDFLGLGI